MKSTWRHHSGVAGLAMLMALGWIGGARGQATTTDLDCVIEPHSIVNVGTPSEGIIDRVLVQRGDVVKHGQVLARLRSELESINVELAKIHAEDDVEVESQETKLRLARNKAARTEALRKRHVVAEAANDEAQAAAKVAETDVEAAKLRQRVARVQLKQAQAALAQRTILSPIDGVVTKVETRAGEYAYVQNPLMTVASLNPLHVEVFAPISLYGKVKEGTIGEVMPVEPVGGVYRAKVTVVDQVFDAASGTFGVRLDLPNLDLALPAGLKCRVRFDLGNPPR